MPRLLVSNCTNDPETGGVYLLHTESGELRRVHDQPTRGMTHAPDGVYVVGNRGAVHHLDPRTWKATARVDLELHGSHDLRWSDAGCFYLVASHGNLVLRLDAELRVLDRLQLVEDEGDVCHANCLLEVDGRLLLTVFTLSPGRREEKRKSVEWRTGGKVLELDWEKRGFRVLHEPLAQPHSMVWQDGRLFLCQSFTSEVTELSLGDGSRRALYRRFGFVRGLAFAGGRAYAGVSRVRRELPLAERIQGLFRLRCGVVELDAKSWKARREFRVPGAEVYEILPLDEGASAGSRQSV